MTHPIAPLTPDTHAQRNVAPSAEQTLQLAITHHYAGRLSEAERLYRAILERHPLHPDAHHNLGMLALQLNQPAAGLSHFKSALEANPNHLQYWLSYIDALLQAGHTAQARQVLEQGRRLGLSGAAVDALTLRTTQQTGMEPDPQEANTLATLFAEARYAEAEALASTMTVRFPLYGTGWKLLGLVLEKTGRSKDALAPMQKAASLLANDAEAHSNLGNVLHGLTRLTEAEASYRRALEIRPDFADAHNNRGNVLKDMGRHEDAVTSYKKALEIRPDLVEVLGNLGSAYKDQGRHDLAIEQFRKALLLKPDFARMHGVLLFTLNYHPDMSADDIRQAYREYDACIGVPLRSTWRVHDNNRDPHRRLRVGYVSPEFRYQSSSRNFLEPLLSHHDKTQLEVFAYAELVMEDDMTARYKRYVDHLIPTRGMSDEALAERIRRDGIDILIDLAGHTANNRLSVFARKPAPVSLSWLGFGCTTGLSAIDHFLTDEVCAPSGFENLFSERPWRITTPSYAYRPTAGMGEVSSLPALTKGHITFGTLTRSVRINHRTISVWSQILQSVPGSHLVIDSSNFTDPVMQEQLAARFAGHGIARDRLEIGFHSPPWDVLRGIDIGLDCFPHNSGTTLFETLYMGVPYITLADRPSVGRLGSSIVTGAGHPEWITDSEANYVARAVELASDVTRLSKIRSTLREQMENSPLRDEAGFARKVEAAYRGMWHDWCETGGHNTGDQT